jgi:hypothetical protein
MCAVILLTIAACGTPDSHSSSDVKDISDIASMQRQPDGTFSVICTSGRQEVVTAEQIRIGQVCVGTGPSPGSVYCRQASSSSVFSPARTESGAWLDDSPGTTLANCQQQIERAYSGYYCRQLKNSPTLFSPAKTSDGTWLDDAPGTSLDDCASQIDNVDFAVYCRQLKNSPTLFSPAKPSTGAWLDDAPGTELAACGRQVSRARTSLYCRQLKNSPTLFSPARIADGGWVDNAPGTSLDVCLQQI